MPAYATLIIDSSVTSLPGAAGIEEGAIGAAITAVETNISSPNNITVDIDFTNMSGGLGESTTGFYAPTYYQYYNAFKAVATQPNQLTALASLGPAPSSGTPNPVNGTANVIITSAEGRNLGFNRPPSTEPSVCPKGDRGRLRQAARTG